MATIPGLREKLRPLLRGGLAGGIYAVIAYSLIAAAQTKTLPMTIIAFLATIGNGHLGNVLDRLIKGERVSQTDLAKMLAMPEELEAVRKLVEDDHEDREVLFEIINQAMAAYNELQTLHVENTEAHGAMHTDLQSILERLKPTALTPDQRRRVLKEYARSIVNSPSCKTMSTCGLMAESDRLETSIREPMLDDTFIEPRLAGKASLRNSGEEIVRLLEVAWDEDEETSSRDEAGKQLLELQCETWEEIRKSGSAELASKALDGKSAVVILGDPGSGKSTLLRWLMVEHAKLIAEGTDGPIPVFVPIGDYANACDRKDDKGLPLPMLYYLAERIEAQHNGMREVLLQALSANGDGILLLLDGLDEVPRELRRKAAHGIQNFVAEYTRAGKPSQVLVSSRFFGFQEAPINDPAIQLVVVPFEDQQIRAFARKWYLWLERFLHAEKYSEAEAGTQADRFEEVLFARPQITELARNPLLLTMIAVIVKSGKRLPQRRVELYDMALRQLMTQWQYLRSDGRTADDFTVDYNEACQIWAPIARWMHEVGTGAVHEEDLKCRLKDRLKELEIDQKPEEWLTVRGDKCCLLQERGPHIFGFLHQTFQEYLAAMDIYHDGEFIEEVPRYVEDPRWHEVLHLACGHLGVICHPPKKREVTDLLTLILNNGSRFENLLHRDLFLAASCIADEVKPKKEIEQDIVHRLLTLAASKGVAPLRIQAMELAADNCHVQLDDPGLAQIEKRIAIDPHCGVRLALLDWLNHRTGPCPDALYRELATQDTGASSYLAAALAWHVTQNRELLANLLMELPVWGRIGSRVREVLLNNQPEIVTALASPNARIRLSAAFILLKTDCHDLAIAKLKDLLRYEYNPTRRIAAEMLLDTECHGLAIATLVELLACPEAKEQIHAGTALTGCGFENFVSHMLLDFLPHSNLEIRRIAGLQLLNTTHREQAIVHLRGMLNDAAGFDRYTVANGLLQTGYRAEALDALKALCKEGRGIEHYYACRRLLSTECYEEAVNMVVDRVANADAQATRQRAAERYWGLSTMEAGVSALVTALEKLVKGKTQNLGPEDGLYEAAWLYATLVTQEGTSM